MTPEDFFAAFDAVSDAPSGIAQLRDLVRQLAVRGQLVAQDPTDEPAAVLLSRIAEEQAELAKRKAIPRPKALSAISLAKVPFDIPTGWAAVRLASLGGVVGGKTPSKSQPAYWTGGIPWVSPKDMKRLDIGGSQDEVSQSAVDDGLFLIPARSVLVVVRSGILRHTVPVALTSVPCTVNQDIKALVCCPSVLPEYVRLMIQGFETFILENLTKTGTTVESMKVQEFFSQPFLMPPLMEQYRIVARVDELMALLDRLEAAKEARDTTRAQLRDAALAALQDANDAEEVKTAWSRIADHMHDLFTDPADIPQLRQTCLELAVKGLLSEQSESDPPASEFLGDRTEPTEDGLPTGWAWSSLARLGDALGGGTPSKRNAGFWDGSIPWISPKDMKCDLIGTAQDFITEAAVESSSVKRIPTGSLLMVVRGMILAHSFPVALTTVETTINQDMKALVPFDPRLTRYLLLVMKAAKRRVLELVSRSTHGTCKLPTRALFEMPLAIPPLPEQERIVWKVGEVMELLDRLETSLSDLRATQEAFSASAVRTLPEDGVEAPGMSAITVG